MSGYITRNALMIDNPTFGPPLAGSMLPTTLANPLAAPAWGSPQLQAGTGGPGLAMPAGVQTGTGGPQMAMPAPGWGMQPGVQTGTGGVDLAMPTAGNPAMSNDDLMKALAQLYGGQAQPQAQTPQQQLQQAINADQANYHGREGGGLV